MGESDQEKSHGLKGQRAPGPRGDRAKMAGLFRNQRSWGQESDAQGLERLGTGDVSQEDSVTGPCE